MSFANFQGNFRQIFHPTKKNHDAGRGHSVGDRN